MNDKLRLDYFLSVGGKLTKDDGCYNVENEEPNVFKEVMQKGDAFAGQLRFSGEGYGIYGKGDLKHLVITSFTDRENEGVQPVPDDFPVVANLPLGACSRLASEICWSDIFSRVIVTWKPDYGALLKMQAEHDKHNESIIKACDEVNKKESEMVYTKEMKDNGEFPSVGMKFSTEFYGNHIAEAVSKTQVCFIGNNGNFDALDIKACLPYKTPEEIELEEAKKKQVDIATNEIMTLTNLLYKDANFLATKLQSKGFLNEIILPLKK